MAERPEEIFTTELIWDAGMEGTAIPREVPVRAPALQVGPDAGWLPAHLMTLAAASCFMTTLLRLAEEAGARVLGYVSNSRLLIARDRSQRPTLTLLPCVVVPSEADVEAMRELCERALRMSDICRALEGCVRLEPDIQVLAGGTEAAEP